jgi:hypothetical protein
MRKLQKSLVTLFVLIALCAGAVSASANSNASKERTLSGRINSIDLGSRTLTVREEATRRIIKVRVPEGVRLKTNHHAYTRVGLEQLLPGMVIRDLPVN